MRFYLLKALIFLGLSFAQETQTLELELLIKAPPEILFNHVNPVVFSLSSPGGEIAVEATGELYKDDPEIYWQTLNPVRWRLELPGLKSLDVQITARLALCDKQQGLCYFQDVYLEEKINLKQSQNKQTLTFTLDRLDY